MADLLGLSSKIIDEGVSSGPVNRITHELSEIAPGVAMVEAFSHSVVFETDDGLVVFDTSGAQGGKLVVDAHSRLVESALQHPRLHPRTHRSRRRLRRVPRRRGRRAAHRARRLPDTKTCRADSIATT